MTGFRASQPMQAMPSSGSTKGSRATRKPPTAAMPEPFTGSEVIERLTLKDVPTPEALEQFLSSKGIDMTQWGKGNYKDVGKYWKEIEGDEAGLEIWKKRNGDIVPVRVTHVLRAKVSSPENYERGIFLFNTWQQYGDGRKRTRNGLLSEKLTLDEMPLLAHLHEVCTRAVTTEEMACVVDSAVKVFPGQPGPQYDPAYKCPLEVVREEFVEHTVEVENSKSYPGMMTVYHLYTVDILCNGLPVVDFNTLEFDHEDKDGNRKLKYVHAWIWLQWNTIQRYLFEGSEIKERKGKGDFETPDHLEAWLNNFNIDLDSWGMDGFKSIGALWHEVEKGETHLEHWARFNGVPLVMRVCHVIQLKVTNSDYRQPKKSLFHVWQQTSDGFVKDINRPLSSKMIVTGKRQLGKADFEDAAKEAIEDQLSHMVDVHFRLGKDVDLENIPGEHPTVTMTRAEFSDLRYDLEDSPSFKDMVTMYHIYTVDVEVAGLPMSDFVSVVTHDGHTQLYGWRWVTWQQSLDIVHTVGKIRERKERDDKLQMQDRSQSGAEMLHELVTAADKLNSQDSQAQAVKKLSHDLQAVLHDVLGRANQNGRDMTSVSAKLPPSMVSTLAEGKLVSDSFVDEALKGHQQSLERSRLILGVDGEDRASTGKSVATMINKGATNGAAPKKGGGSGFFFCRCNQKAAGDTPAEVLEP